jgi:predicted dehydrogenase
MEPPARLEPPARRSTAAGVLPVVLAGVHGHGRNHLANLERLAGTGSAARLAGICDLAPPSPQLRDRLPGVLWGDDLAALIDRVGARIAVVCTPIHTHAGLAAVAARKGCAILLEKPPAPDLASFQDLAAQVAAAGVPCQVGFQDLASPAVERVRTLIAEGAVGRLRGIGAAGTWVRDSSYFTRAPWAGRRRLAGSPVTDGVLSNPFAHAVAAALVLDGSTGRTPPSEIELELHRANEIEADDTSCLRLRTERGTAVVVAATLCAERTRDPVISVHGTRGRIDLRYKQGRVRLQPHVPAAHPGPATTNQATTDQATTDQATTDQATTGERVWEFTRPDLLENLVDHLLGRTGQLLVPLGTTTAFMHVLEAIRTAPDPAPIPPDLVRTTRTATGTCHVVPGVDRAVLDAADRLALFSELGLGWTRTPEAAR